MKKELNEILLRRNLKVIATKSKNTFSSKEDILAINFDISQLGYVLSKALIHSLRGYSKEELICFHKDLVDILKNIVGSKAKYKPLFPNFPLGVPSNAEGFHSLFKDLFSQNLVSEEMFDILCDKEFFQEDLLHVTLENGNILRATSNHMISMHDNTLCQLKDLEVGNIIIMNNKEAKELRVISIELAPYVTPLSLKDAYFNEAQRTPLSDTINFKVINVGTYTDIENIFKNLVASKAILSERDKEDIKTIVKEYLDSTFINFLPEEITIKETLVLVVNLMKEYNIEKEKFSKLMKTATDVLRFATAISDGDISLVENTTYKSFSSKERNIILYLLNSMNNIEEDMYTHRMKWLRIGERIHPNAFRTKYKKAYEAFNNLRNKEKEIITFNKTVGKLKTEKKYFELANVLSNRSGEFFRSLDFLMRNTGFGIIPIVEKASEKATVKMLIQVVKFLKARTNKNDIRYFTPKGAVSKMKVIENTLKPLNKELVEKVIFIMEQAIIKELRKREQLGNVLVSESLKDFLMPLSQRTAGDSVRKCVRGSRELIDLNKTIRMFLYWKENGSRVDVDLSAVGFDTNWNYIQHISYTRLKGSGNSVHSGDITSAPNGASEFIDIDIPSFKNTNVRYVAMTVTSFTGQNFDTFEAFAGFMERESIGSGEIFEERTVKDKFTVNGNKTNAIPIIFDLEEGYVIFSDIFLAKNLRSSNVESTFSKVAEISKAICDFRNTKPNLYDLFMYHARARAKTINKDLTADTVFKKDGDITPYMLEEISAEWL